MIGRLCNFAVHMRRYRAVADGVVFGLLALSATPLTAQVDEGRFERGGRLASSGAWQSALDVWASLPDSLLGTGRSDPRVGPAFMATVVKQDDPDRFEEATQLYLWGFSGTDLEPMREHVESETRRILPLLSPQDSVRWMPLFEGPVERLALRIGRFWLEHDPTPETAVNERLIEHWKRIVTAREDYTYNRSSVYDTDDRGVVYVKYGPPDTRARGSLGASEMELKIRIPSAEARMRMRQFDPNPQYELWKYGGLHPEEFTYYLFGNVRGTGPFEWVDGPMDLISDAARSLSSASFTPGGVRAQHYLELFYYRDLAILGGHFGRRFDELSSTWDGFTMRRNVFGGGGRSPSAAALESFSYRFSEEDKYAPIGVPTVSVRSDFEGAARSVEMVVQAVRILDPSNQPMVVVQALSAPRLRLAGQDRRAGLAATLRDTEHTLIVRDRQLDEAGRIVQMAPAALGGISVFNLRNPPQPLHFTVFGTVSGERTTEGDTLSLPGQGHAYVEEPLRSDPSVFEVSDLAVGTPWNAPTGATNPLPFPLLPGNVIWTLDALRVYLELYHLQLDAAGLSHYALDFRLLPMDEAGNRRTNTEPITLGFQQETDSRTVRRHFDIGLAGLDTGFYRLEVDATDRMSGATVTRVTEIEIIG
jgi:GWxTD domain-containing protein